jgi:hypothetical protein
MVVRQIKIIKYLTPSILSSSLFHFKHKEIAVPKEITDEVIIHVSKMA